MSSSIELNVQISLIYTIQAIRFLQSALVIINKLLTPNQIKRKYYQDAFDSLIIAFDSLILLPIDLEQTLDTSSTNKIVIAVEDNLIIILSDNQAQLSINMTYEAIKYIGKAILLATISDDIPLIQKLIVIKTEFEIALYELVTGINE